MRKFLGRLALGIPGWLVYTVCMIPCILAGFVLCAISPSGRGRDQDGVWRTHWLRKWMWLWDNDEDGIDGAAVLADGSFKNPGFTKSDSWTAQYGWSAWRNSVGNARRTRLFGLTVEPVKQGFLTKYGSGVTPLDYTNFIKEGPYVAWQGWRYELKFCWNPEQPDWRKRRYCWIGWRIAQCTEVTKDVGFAFQLGAAL